MAKTLVRVLMLFGRKLVVFCLVLTPLVEGSLTSYV
jgi:hypothetical protein